MPSCPTPADGTTRHGQLGNGESGSIVRTAGAIPELGGGIVEIARGYEHTLVLKGE